MLNEAAQSLGGTGGVQSRGKREGKFEDRVEVQERRREKDQKS